MCCGNFMVVVSIEEVSKRKNGVLKWFVSIENVK